MSVEMELIQALVKDCPDGLCSKHYTPTDLQSMLAQRSPEEIENAVYEMEQAGFLTIPAQLGGWDAKLAPQAYEALDSDLMGWSTKEDAKTLAKLMLDLQEGRSHVLLEKLGWTKRRFNPAQRQIVDQMPTGCVRGAMTPDFVTLGISINPQSSAVLRQILSS